MAVNTYYFDGSDASATDPNTKWGNDANAFDSSDATSAYVSYPDNGSTSSNFLKAEGTNAPGSGDSITQVRARVRVSGEDFGGQGNAAIYTDGLGELLGTATRTGTFVPTWGSYVTLSTPSGGWSWTTIQALEVKIYASGMTNVNDGIYPHKVEVEVTSEAATTAIKTFQGLAYASTKTVDGLAIASVKTAQGLA